MFILLVEIIKRHHTAALTTSNGLHGNTLHTHTFAFIHIDEYNLKKLIVILKPFHNYKLLLNTDFVSGKSLFLMVKIFYLSTFYKVKIVG